MSSLPFRITIIAAFLAALVLIILNIRLKKVPARGLFSLSLGLLLGLAPQAGNSASAKASGPVWKQVFRTQKRWLAIRNLWKKLDALTPRGEMGYMNTLEWEQQQALIKEAEQIFGYPWEKINDPAQAGKINPLEKAIYSLLRERIDEYGTPYDMMTRMMPPPSSTYRHTLVSDLERQTDLLLDLKKSGKLKSPEFQSALSRLQQDVTVFAVLDILQQHNRGRYHFEPRDKQLMFLETGLSTDQIIRSWIAGYEDSFQKSLAYYKEELAKPANQSPEEQERLLDYQKELQTYHDQVLQELKELDTLTADLDAFLNEVRK